MNPNSRTLITRDADLSYDNAMNGLNHAFWKLVIKSELSSLDENKTLSFVPRENAQNIVSSKWVFKRKFVIHPDESLTEKAKARSDVRGFQQVQGVDFNDTEASVVNFTSVRAVFSLCACLELELH